MKVPTKRAEAELCKDKEIKYNAVVVNDGKLQDVFIGIADEQFKADYESDKAVTSNRKRRIEPQLGPNPFVDVEAWSKHGRDHLIGPTQDIVDCTGSSVILQEKLDFVLRPAAELLL